MYLSKIELFGFKSFAHRVRIHFDKGLTAIVGPNGCGKTNVVDAIRWVLGEQKSMLLRSPKMENIIFNGTKRLKPLSFTEVSITIENTRNILPTEYTEVTVTRRLYRNGDSDYLLNMVPCRLKDILDLFADTGMGSDAYSVIELKMIEEIISNKSEERLKLFEEAAGITRYKQRRKQTFRQLESASRDLARVDDVLAEVEKKVRNLRLQVRKAERLKEIREELRTLDLTLSAISMDEHLQKLRPLLDSIAAEERQCHELAATIAKLDSAHQESELRQLELERKLADAQKELNASNQLVHTLEKQLLQHKEKQKNLLQTIERLNYSIADKGRKRLEQEALSKELSEKQTPLQEVCTAQLAEFERLKKQEVELNSALDASRQALQSERRAVAELQKSLNALNLTRQSLRTRKEHLEGSVNRLDQRKRDLERSMEQAEPERRRTSEAIEEKKIALDELKKEEERLVALKASITEQSEKKKEELLSLKSEHNHLNNRIALCNSILEKFEGLPEGVAFLEKQRAGKPGLGCLSDLISVRENDKKAINAALGESLGYYLCRNLEEARLAVSSLAKADKGKVHFLILDLIDGGAKIDYAEIEGARRAIDLVETPAELSKALNLLLQHCYVVADLDAAEQLGKKHPEALFITEKGEKFTRRGMLYGGSAKGGESVRLGKKAERDRLQKQMAGMAETIAEAENALAVLRKEFSAIDTERVKRAAASISQEISALEKRLARLEAEERSGADQIAHADRERTALIASMQSVLDELEKTQPETLRIEAEIETAQQKVNVMQEELSAGESRSRALHAELQAQQGRYRDAQLDLEKHRFRASACQQTIVTLSDEIEGMQHQIARAEKEVAELGQSIAQATAEHEQAVVVSARQQEALNELESSYRDLQTKNHDTLSNLRDLRRKHDLSQQMLAEFNNRKAKLEQEIAHLQATVMERYGVELEMMPAHVPEGFDVAASRERLAYLQKQKEQFGGVNELALEEYESEKERLDFLTAQKEDLVSAEKQLRETIEEINRTALEKFRETFNQVRKNFIRIFHDLFDPEDEVDLLITTSDEDPLEAHIQIVAKPRGKKPLAIEQLSGGEKALTALSLLFAIYLVKPSPFCILDEVDAPLDDANVGRFIKLLKKFENNTQFIIVTHNKKSMASCQALYGVTMEEEGVSKLIPVKIENARSEETAS
ncbi:MAG TPA: chromosome segregation protein SMC [Chlorobaculum sp.]|uniref:Chromosome partition protein Smc n=1 Tax=Chlorobaculum tepidum (strain ATCC 49652 / DSM 12025 / NBRC 103806 / TLS) TaxID=194439 RepID=SMC_CHLTE|nr:chromosome segregation protein SMC [Chlorobaculum tepidum]Q8KBS6.1 RecName: Full=Chromosome partition protein Smc [Chlorobaculum tepidum TLS]AAM72931.1 SMC family protein [Chlorobaculum tepidum TLS]HBU22559.1 chromosome segregation protein SMC [Chlorobaculum sp.]